jgi:spoIIIJ-associated protein
VPVDNEVPAAAGLIEATDEQRPRQAEEQVVTEPFVEDGRADVALDFTIDVLAAMGMDCTVDLLENDEEDPPEDIRLEIEGKDAGRVIGKKGQTLQALQFLGNRVVNRPGKQRRHVIVDAEGYRARREDTLTTMARRLGKQAVDEGKIITFEPMNPRDRRVVHLALAGFEGVITRSDGEGDDRRVQIIPVRRAGSSGAAPNPV